MTAVLITTVAIDAALCAIALVMDRPGPGRHRKGWSL